MKKNNLIHVGLAALLAVSAGCRTSTDTTQSSTAPAVATTASVAKASAWPKGVTYEIFVQSFCDSDNDGIGDIPGMTSRLDYLQDLGVEAIWLMPMNPSPSYHKYDVTDYYAIHPDYGTMADFKEFLDQAHQRGIRVVMDMVLNHSSSEHPWFLDAKANPNSPYRDYYVWAHKDDPQTKAPGKVTGADSDNQQHWHKVPGHDYLYYGYFYGGMPDLNFDNPKLREEVYKIGRYWLNEVGVDGFRLDAARHIFPDDRPDDNHAFWVEFREEMMKAREDVYLVGEVWAPADVVAPYLAGLPALFNFEMSWAILEALQQGKGDSLAIKHANIIDYYEQVNPDFVDATILSNHDQNRIMSEVGNDMEKAKLGAALLLTLPGSPYIYYGEEIGMRGKKPDELIREPFIWDTKSEDECRTTWVQPQYSTDQTVVPAAQQLQDPNSLLNHYRALLKLRNNSPALTSGDIKPLQLGVESVSAYTRTAGEESVLVLHNLSGQPVSVTLPENAQGYEEVLFKSKDFSKSKSQLTLPAQSSIVLR